MVKRFSDTSKLAARGIHAAGVRQGAIQSIGSVLGTGAALATLIIGVDLAMKGIITSGTLVGTMMLTWRITGPSQAFFLGLPRIRAALGAIRGLDQSLAISTVTTPVVALERMPEQAPSIESEGAYFRHDGDSEAAIAGVSFAIAPGSITVILGPNGAGKTTLLRLLSGVLTPQSGRILINGSNLRQYDPDEVMLSTLYLPSGLDLLGESHDALDGQTPWVKPEAAYRAALHEGGSGLVSGVQPRRADTAIYVLMDDPVRGADEAHRAAFLSFLEAMKGRATVIFSTHDMSLIQAADNAVVLNRGAMVYFGPVEPQAQPTQNVEEAAI